MLELFFDTDNLISPERFSRMMPGIELIDKTVGDILKKLCDKGTSLRPLKILEIGARTGETTAALIPYLSEDKVVYTASDASLFFTDKIEERFNKIPFVNTSIFEIENVFSQVGQDNTFDIVIAPNSLHRAADVRNALKNIQKILSPDGVVILTESTINSSVQNITVGFIEEGFNRFEDQRAESGLPLFSAEQWLEILASEGFEAPFSIFSQMSEIFRTRYYYCKSPIY